MTTNFDRMGTVKKRPDADGRPGLWIARWRETNGTQRKKSFRRRVDAETFLRNIETARDAGTYVTPGAGRATVAEFGEPWLARRVDLTPKSLSSLRSIWRAQILPRWGSVPLDRVTHGDIEQWTSDLVQGGLSASRTRQCVHTLAALLDAAIRARLLPPVNPARDVALPRLRTTRHRYLSHAELADLAAAAGPYEALVLVLGYTGLRWGEATALRRRDYDPIARRLRVEEAASDVDGVIIVGDAKDHEKRVVPVPGFVAAILDEHVEGLDPDALIFAAPRGGYLRNANWRRNFWDAAVKTAGLGPLTPHELRHTAASLAIAAGADVLMVARMLGHAKPSMTLDRYGHLWGDGLDDVAARLDAAAAPRTRPERRSASAE